MDRDHAFAELIHEYIAECLPLAEGVTEALLEVERQWRAGHRDAGDLGALKGRLHTLKGNSAMMGLRPMQTVAHALEDLCARLLAEPAARNEESAALLVEGGGLLSDLIRAARESDDATASELYVARVRGATDAHAAAETPVSPPLRLERRRNDRRTGLD